MRYCHVLVSGKVQGVSFRAFTKEAAYRHDIRGIVRNLDDGRVEVIALGEDENMNGFFGELRKGPISSHVDDVEVKEMDGVENYRDFRISY